MNAASAETQNRIGSIRGLRPTRSSRRDQCSGQKARTNTTTAINGMPTTPARSRMWWIDRDEPLGNGTGYDQDQANKPAQHHALVRCRALRRRPLATELTAWLEPARRALTQCRHEPGQTDRHLRRRRDRHRDRLLPEPRGAEAIVIERHEVAGSASGKSGGFLALDWCRGTALDRLARRSFELHAALPRNSAIRGATAASRPSPGHAARATIAGGVGARPWLSAGVTLTGRIGSPQTTALVEPRAYTAGMMRAAGRTAPSCAPVPSRRWCATARAPWLA